MYHVYVFFLGSVGRSERRLKNIIIGSGLYAPGQRRWRTARGLLRRRCGGSRSCIDWNVDLVRRLALPSHRCCCTGGRFATARHVIRHPIFKSSNIETLRIIQGQIDIILRKMKECRPLILLVYHFEYRMWHYDPFSSGSLGYL
jgi:hypothetical protein